jgi:3-oxoacyl-[acyl-carrier protein] reductase
MNAKPALPSELFLGKVAIVTGSSRGVGRATALRLAEGGCDVAVNYLSNDEEAAKTVSECMARGVRAFAVQGDASVESDAKRIVDETIGRLGRLDYLVLNAGIWKGSPISEMTEERWNEVMDTNLKSAWAMSKHSVPEMRKQDRGAIVLVSSTAGQRGEANYSNYAASKGGQISFTKALSTELAPSIRVNCVAPGWIDTAMVRPVFEDEEYLERVLNGIPLHRMASTDDVALSICFLLSDWSRHITGEVLNINGGAVLPG